MKYIINKREVSKNYFNKILQLLNKKEVYERLFEIEEKSIKQCLGNSLEEIIREDWYLDYEDLLYICEIESLEMKKSELKKKGKTKINNFIFEIRK